MDRKNPAGPLTGENMEMKSLLEKLVASNASDLLLVVGSAPCFRINNSLVKEKGGKLTAAEIEEMAAVIISREDLAEFKKTLELDTAYEDLLSRYRINLHYQKGSIAAAIRRVPKEIPALQILGLPPIVSDFTTLKRGLVLVTGPTGCGKSTTQASMIDLVNSSRSCHIVTIEDPIEFSHASKAALVEQREVGLDTNSFSEALKRVLRQIPDILFVGEMRDKESVQMAVTAAETGHLVISTLHTQDAAQTVDRIIDIFPPHQQPQIRTMLSLTIQAIISQQLIPKKDGSGLVLACEIMVATPAIKNIIRKGSPQDIYSMIEMGKQFGMQSMDAALVGLVKGGIISMEEAIIHSFSREEIGKKLEKL